jgi:hypothetical protein
VAHWIGNWVIAVVRPNTRSRVRRSRALRRRGVGPTRPPLFRAGSRKGGERRGCAMKLEQQPPPEIHRRRRLLVRPSPDLLPLWSWPLPDTRGTPGCRGRHHHAGSPAPRRRPPQSRRRGWSSTDARRGRGANTAAPQVPTGEGMEEGASELHHPRVPLPAPAASRRAPPHRRHCHGERGVLGIWRVTSPATAQVSSPAGTSMRHGRARAPGLEPLEGGGGAPGAQSITLQRRILPGGVSEEPGKGERGGGERAGPARDKISDKWTPPWVVSLEFEI